ncbi:SRPBCC family protein [Aquimarina brevivitae]|uniref:Polyketide cyclase/dehydrase/lipid transport protein n=1 Tax=Aquimarina brevivitae TaxID=323412 RepID=A0A4Q7PHZ9_9FLAO|nr:GyrI-like domain-containing protein [Aquimarina brevivitae]RZT00214.1 polyketide cyclase/dehydrase/lipid transport protein [Aquimarina brevivitae]
MKIIKYLFFLLLFAIIAGAVYVFTIDGDYQVEESKVIEAPDELLFDTVNYFRTWEKWGPWMEETDDMIITYADKVSGPGAYYSWKSETEGDGNMETVKVAPFSSIDQKITFITPMGESVSDVYWKFEKIEPKKTKVTWGMKGTQSFMEKLYWVIQDSTLSQSIKPMYAKGLNNIEEYVQERMEAYSISVDGVTEHGGGFYMYSATASDIAIIPEKMKQMLPTVDSYMYQNNLPKTGMPFTLYNEYNEEQGTAIYSVGIPTRDKVITPQESAVLCGFMPRQKVIKTTLKGDFKNLEEAWDKTYDYMAKNNLEALENGSPFEVYRVDPNIQPNPAEWITEIYIPIK